MGVSAGVVADEARAGPADDVREWWQRLGEARRRWSLRHETAVRRLRLARSVWLWLSVAWLVVLVVVRPELRESLRVAVQLYWLLVVWFLLTRTRTVPWRLVAGLFSVAVVWSIAAGLMLHELAKRAAAVHVGSLTVPGRAVRPGREAALPDHRPDPDPQRRDGVDAGAAGDGGR